MRLKSSSNSGSEGRFQFTHPGRGATHIAYEDPDLTYVSIHAPREGCDWIAYLVSVLTALFQFTHPGRGATRAHYVIAPREWVSIHAPREGCDNDISTSVRYALLFQFTHPGRGATVWCKVAYYGADKQA